MRGPGTQKLVESRNRNWFIFRFRGLHQQMRGFSHQQHILENPKARSEFSAAIQSIEAAMEAAGICLHELDSALLYSADLLECAKCGANLDRKKKRRS